jgi:MarR family transcriptional regulator, organic hydroperoxide resistance regulator
MFELSRYIPYLVRRTSARVDEIIRPELAAVGLTLEMWRVVVSIYGHGPQSLGDLAARTSVNLSTLSRLIGAMERAKLVRRRRVVGNGRTVKIDLLPLGRKRCRGFLPFAMALERRITHRFSESELRLLRALLGRLYTAVAEDAPPPVKAQRRR